MSTEKIEQRITGFSLQALRDASTFPMFPGDAPSQDLVPYPEHLPGIYDFSQSGAPGAARVSQAIAQALQKEFTFGLKPPGYRNINNASREAGYVYETLWVLRLSTGIPVSPSTLALTLNRVMAFRRWLVAPLGRGGLADEMMAIRQDWEGTTAAVQRTNDQTLLSPSFDAWRLGSTYVTILEHIQGLADQARAELRRGALAELLRDRAASLPTPEAGRRSPRRLF
jgi:hypothetical protein